MAETRKFNPATSAIGEAVREALGDIRPTTPGEKPAQSTTTEQILDSPSAASFVMGALPDFLTSLPHQTD